MNDMKRFNSYAVILLIVALMIGCQKSPTDSQDDQIPDNAPDLLGFQKMNEGVPAAMDTVSGVSEQTRQGGVYAAIVRDIIWTNHLLGIPLLSTLSVPVQNPGPGQWVWEKQIFQATHTLTAQWDGQDGYDWTYIWDGGNFQEYLALDGHTDVPGLNGNYTMYYNDARHNVYGTKTWKVENDSTLTIRWIRAKYDPHHIPKREFLTHFRSDGSGDLTFWEDDAKRFYIEWNPNGTGSWELWTKTGNHLTGTF